jgi:hypothetical protein
LKDLQMNVVRPVAATKAFALPRSGLLAPEHDRRGLAHGRSSVSFMLCLTCLIFLPFHAWALAR